MACYWLELDTLTQIFKFVFKELCDPKFKNLKFHLKKLVLQCLHVKRILQHPKSDSKEDDVRKCQKILQVMGKDTVFSQPDPVCSKKSETSNYLS